jgi:hypothetical protein
LFSLLFIVPRRNSRENSLYATEKCSLYVLYHRKCRFELYAKWWNFLCALCHFRQPKRWRDGCCRWAPCVSGRGKNPLLPHRSSSLRLPRPPQVRRRASSASAVAGAPPGELRPGCRAPPLRRRPIPGLPRLALSPPLPATGNKPKTRRCQLVGGPRCGGTPLWSTT